MKKFLLTVAAAFLLFPTFSHADSSVGDEDTMRAAIVSPSPVVEDLKAGVQDKGDKTATTTAPTPKPTLKDHVLDKGVSIVTGKLAPDLGDKDKKLVGSVAKTAVDSLSIESFKDAYKVATAKATKELEEREKQGLANSSQRKFWTGFKHGFVEGVKLGTKVVFNIVKEHGLTIALALL
ncbi:MAG: hypothetical protein H2057_02140 [Alphaproteobacteria bacterium]|nr:hypothetical protein [Alphaproteobacteria bacterium]